MLRTVPCAAAVLALAAGLLAGASVRAQRAGDNSAAAQRAQEACRSEVSKFEEAIGFIRRSQGNQAAADLKEKLLPARLESEILFKEGYCGLARHIREKKLR